MATSIVNIHEAKTHLSRLIERAAHGEDIIIAKAGTPKVRLVPMTAGDPVRQPGRFAGLLEVTEAFFEPFPAEELGAWEGVSGHKNR